MGKLNGMLTQQHGRHGLQYLAFSDATRKYFYSLSEAEALVEIESIDDVVLLREFLVLGIRKPYFAVVIAKIRKMLGMESLP